MRLLFVSAFLSLITSCSMLFEVPSQDMGAGEPDERPSEDPSHPIEDTPNALVASAERTNKGHVVEGSFLDSQKRDGASETIVSEESKGKQKVEHRWLILGLPQGEALELELTGVARSNDPEGLIEISMAIEDYDHSGFRAELPPLVVAEGTFRQVVRLPGLDASNIEIEIKRDAEQEESWVLDVDYLGIHTANPSRLIHSTRGTVGAE